VVERTRPVKVDGAVVSACFVGEGAAFVLGEETLVLARKGEERRIALHGGAILSAVETPIALSRAATTAR
jgi:hypothetical protein